MKLIYVFILLSLCNSTIILRDNDSLPLTLFINNRIYLYVKGNAYTYDSNGNDQQFLKSYINYDTSAYQQYEAGKVYLLYDTYFYEEDTLQYTLPSSSSPTKTFSFLTFGFYRFDYVYLFNNNEIFHYFRQRTYNLSLFTTVTSLDCSVVSNNQICISILNNQAYFNTYYVRAVNLYVQPIMRMFPALISSITTSPYTNKLSLLNSSTLTFALMLINTDNSVSVVRFSVSTDYTSINEFGTLFTVNNMQCSYNTYDIGISAFNKEEIILFCIYNDYLYIQRYDYDITRPLGDVISFQSVGTNRMISIVVISSTQFNLVWENTNTQTNILMNIYSISECTTIETVEAYKNSQYKDFTFISYSLPNENVNKQDIIFTYIPKDGNNNDIILKKEIDGSYSQIQLNVHYSLNDFIASIRTDFDGVYDILFVIYRSNIKFTKECTNTVKINLCYPSCYSCSDAGSLLHHNCLQCNPNYYWAYTPITNCITESEKQLNWYLDTSIGAFRECNSHCASCYGPLVTECNTCAISYYKIYQTDTCMSIELLNQGYYLDVIDNTFHKCYSTCSTCITYGTLSNHNCIKCDNSNSFYYMENKKSQCVNEQSKPTNYYLNTYDKNNFYYAKCSEHCLTCRYDKDNNDDECLTCETDYFIYEKKCINRCPGSLYLYNYGCHICPINTYSFLPEKSCVSICPKGYTQNEELKLCVISPITSDENEYDEFLNDIIDSIIDHSNNQSIISNDNSTAQIYKESEKSLADLSASNNSLSTILLGECSDILHSIYSIPSTEDLIVLKIDTKTSDSYTNTVDYYIFDPNGNMLDLSYCDSINVNIPINGLDSELLEQSQSLAEQGIDVFDASSAFFNDICFPYSDSENDTDVPLSVRRDEYYQNVTFCSGDCVYDGINYETTSVNCKCDTTSKDNGLQSITKNELKNEFTTSLTSSNIKVIVCYKLVFNAKKLQTNIGSWIMIAIITTEFFLFIVTTGRGVKPIWKFIKQFPLRASPIEDDDTGRVIDKNYYRFFLLNNSSIIKPRKNKNLSNTTMNTRVNDGHSSHLVINNEIDKRSAEPVVYTGEGMLNRNINQPISERRKSSFKLNEEMSDEELNDLEYEQALLIDDRNFIQFYWGYLKEEEIIINSFIKPCPLELRCIKITIFFTSIAIEFALNALFYTDSLIATKYKNGGTLDFIISLPKSIYSSLIGFNIRFILNFLSNSKKQLTDIIKKEKQSESIRHKARKVLNRLKKKLVAFFIINFIFVLFFWYYVSAFCAVYHDTQISWVTGGVISFGISLLVPFLICLLFSSIRVLALKYQHKTLYSILAFLNYVI